MTHSCVTEATGVPAQAMELPFCQGELELHASLDKRFLSSRNVLILIINKYIIIIINY